MNQTLKIESGLLKAVVVGRFNLEEAKRAFAELVDFAELHKVRKVLLEGREISGNPTVIDRFYYGSFAADLACRLSVKAIFAYVLVPPVLDVRKFGETVAVNRCMVVRTFENTEDARKWLAKSE